jgi:RHS repeat-associated protein
VYDPYGNLLSQSGPLSTANLYRFSSKEQHINGGMYYYGYRFYEPSLQRWINRDPIGERDGRNVYRFVGNDPVGRLDFLGLCKFGFSFFWEKEIIGVRILKTWQPGRGWIICHFSKALVERHRCYVCQNGVITMHIEEDLSDPVVMKSPDGERHASDEGDTPQDICRSYWDRNTPPEYVPY